MTLLTHPQGGVNDQQTPQGQKTLGSEDSHLQHNAQTHVQKALYPGYGKKRTADWL